MQFSLIWSFVMLLQFALDLRLFWLSCCCWFNVFRALVVGNAIAVWFALVVGHVVAVWFAMAIGHVVAVCFGFKFVLVVLLLLV